MPFKDKQTAHQYYLDNKDAYRKRKASWNQDPKNKEKKRKQDRSRHYKKKFGKAMREQFGIDGQEGYEFLREQQNYTCALCGTHENDMPESKMPLLVHDHCHETGRIRGLLCLACNTAIGGYEKCLKLGVDMVEEYLND